MMNSKNTSNSLRAIMNSLRDELLVVDQDFRILEVNDAVLVGFDKNRKQVIGQHCYEISHGVTRPCRRPYHECPIAGVMKTGEPVRVTHTHIHQDNKQKRYIDVIASPIKDGDGRTIAFSELMRDVTEAKKAELQIIKLHHEVQNKE
ncbi:MAG: PAS domain-containing protein, partial [Promethearchaeota archaeon]